MGLRHVDVVGLDRDCVQNGGDKSGTRLTSVLVSQLNTHPELCHGDRGYRYIVLIVDELIEQIRPALGGD